MCMEWNITHSLGSSCIMLKITTYHVPCVWQLLTHDKTVYPSNWTTEYVGYLMSSKSTYTLPTTNECVDKHPNSVEGLDGAGQNSGSGLLNHVGASCNGMACPPYEAGRELTCMVCIFADI